MPETVYLLCALTSVACALLLLRNYRRARLRLVLWTSLCFVFLAVQNILLFVDLVVLSDAIVWLGFVRNAPGMLGVSVLLYGLITDSA